VKACTECDRPAHARGLCMKHYRHWLASSERTESTPYKKPKRVRFTPALWAKWWTRQEPTEHSRQLGAQIQLMRETLR
jgi:hypothetical protein